MKKLDALDRQTVETLAVRPIRSEDELDEVRRLVHDVYVRAGYVAPQPGGRLVYCPHLDRASETTVFVAEDGGRIFGTSSLTLDGPAGFHLDEEYPDESARIRHERRPLASLWRLAIRAPAAERSRILMGLIRANRDFLFSHGVQTCLFTLVPRFERVYQRLFRAQPVASRRAGHGCASEPLAMFRCATVLMRWDVECCPPRWSRKEAP